MSKVDDHGSGAPSMASLAGLRAGAGLVTAAVPESILNTVALVWAEQIAAGEITSLHQLARSTKLSSRYVQRILQCAALSPERVEAIVNGGEPHLPFWKISTEIAADRRSRTC